MKKLLLSFCFLVSYATKSDACVHYPSAYTVWMFMPCIHEADGIPYDYNFLSYTHPTDYQDYNRSTLDTAHYHINAEEWYQYLGKKVSKKEIFAILYHTEPSEYWYNDNERIAHNSFIKTLQLTDYQEEKIYLDFAKTCEFAYNYTSSWDVSREDTLDRQGFKRLLLQGKMMLPKTTKPFVRLRLAFLLVKLCDYLQNKDDALLIYEKYIKKSKIKSWVKASTNYHLGKVTHEARYYLLAFMQSYDKRDAARRILMNLDIDCYYDKSCEKKLRNYLLKCAKNKEEKAAVHCLFAWKSVGRNLHDIKKVYAFSPKQKDISLLIAKEIYDFEDWILTNELTGEPHYKDRFYHENADDFAWEEAYKMKNERLAYQSDLKYLAQFRLFIDKILKEKKAKNLDLIRLEAAHLAFLAKDYKSAKKHLDLLKTSQNIDNQIFIQKNILQFLIKIKKSSSTNHEIYETTRQLFEYIDEHLNEIDNVSEFRSQIALLVGKNYIAKNNIPKGIMLLCQTDRNFGTLSYSLKNAYHYLLDIGQPKDYEDLIALARKKPEKRTRFEKFLFSQEISYNCVNNRDWGYSEGKITDPVWDDEIKRSEAKCFELDTCRILDYKGMYYLNREDLKNTYSTWKRVPNEYWMRAPYHSYVRNSFAGEPHSKTDYIKGIIDAEKALDTATVTKGYLYTQLAHAYQDMSYYGHSWLMREIFRGGNYEEAHVNPKEYFENRKALFYFKKAYEMASNEETAAALAYQINRIWRRNAKREYYSNKENRYSNEEFVYKGLSMRKDWSKRWHRKQEDFEESINCGIELSYWRWQKIN